MTTVLGVLVLLVVGVWLLASYFRPPIAITLLIVLYTLKQNLQTYFSFFLLHSSAFNVLVAVGVGLGLVGSMQRDRFAFVGYKSGYAGLLGLLYLYCVSAMLWTPDASLPYATDLFIVGIPYWTLQVLMLPALFSSMDRFRSAFGPTLIFASVVAVLFLTNPAGNYYQGRYVLELGNLTGKDFGNPLASAQMGGQMAFIAALMIPRGSKMFWLLVRAAAIILGLALAVRAGSRGQLVFSVFLMVALFPMARKVRNLSQFFLTAGGLAFVALLGYFTISILISGSETEQSRWSTNLATKHFDERFATAQLLIDWWVSEPSRWLFGLGANAFSSLPGYGGSYVHNALVEMVCEYGLFGLGLFSALAFVTGRHALELFRRHRDDPPQRAATAVLIAIGLYSFFLALKQGQFLGTPEPYCFWLLIAKINLSERAAERIYFPPQDAHDSQQASYPGYEDVAAAYSKS